MSLLLTFVAGFLLIGAIWVIVTLLIVPGLAEERLGRLEELPAAAVEWQDDPPDTDSDPRDSIGPRRQTRLWIDPGGDWLGRERIVRQTRYVDSHGEVVRSEPEVRVRRRRVRGD